MPLQVIGAAWRRAWKDILFRIVVFCLALLIVFFPIPTFLRTAVYVLLLALVLGWWIYRLLTRGRLLLDCGLYPRKIAFVAVAITLLVLIWVLIGCWTAHPIEVTTTWMLISLCALWAALCCVMALSRLQVRENGVWHYWYLIRWREIASYGWADDGALVLRLGSVPEEALFVPPDQRHAVDELLKRLWSVGHDA